MNGACWRERAVFYLSRLKQIAEIVRSQTAFKFYSTSLLFLYDNTPEHIGDKTYWELRMIDFAQSQYGGTRDDGYMIGVATMIRFFEGLLAKDVN